MFCVKFEEEEKVNKHFEMDCVDRDIQIDDFRDFFEILEEDPSIDDAITAVENVSTNNLFLKRKLRSPLVKITTLKMFV